MESVYHANGVSFRFPPEWNLSEERSDFEIAISVDSPETSFWSLTLFSDRPSPTQVIEAALDAYRQEYDEIDIYPGESQFLSRDTIGRDVEFLYLEMVNSVFLRAFQTEQFTALVLLQGTDPELRETRPTLEAICQSLQFDSDHLDGLS